jgi:isoleucyl-tRNA synthetase
MKFSNDKNLKEPELRTKCREFANSCITKQKEEFKRWGVLGDWDNCYNTMDKQYESLQLEIFLKMYLDGNVFNIL